LTKKKKKSKINDESLNQLLFNHLIHLPDNIIDASSDIPWIKKRLGPKFLVTNIGEQRAAIMKLLRDVQEIKWDVALDYPHLQQLPDFTIFECVKGIANRLLGRLIMIDQTTGFAQFPDRTDINRILTMLSTHGIDVSGLQLAIQKRKDKIGYILGNVNELTKHQKKVLFEELAETYSKQITIVERNKTLIEQKDKKIETLEKQLHELEARLKNADSRHSKKSFNTLNG